MRKVTLGDTGLEVSVLGFGCSQLMGRVGQRASLRALSEAFDRGVNYFDVARSYGYGDAERLVGQWAKGKRGVVIATKFGILPGKRSSLLSTAKAVARPVLRAFPMLRSAARSALGSQFTPGAFSVGEVRSSVETSLRELGRDAVDVLHLHGCSKEVLDHDDMWAELESLKRAGKVRAIGVASGTDAARSFAAEGPSRVSILQYPFAVDPSPFDAASARSKGFGVIAYQPFAGGGDSRDALVNRLASLANDANLSEGLRRRLAKPSRGVLAEVVLNSATTEREGHMVLCSMVRPKHIEQNARAMESLGFTRDELDRVRAALATPVGAMAESAA